MKRKAKAFTLIELMVVVMIIGLLIAILLPALQQAMEQANRIRCRANLSGLAKAIQIYSNANNNNYPSNATATAYGTAPDSMAALWLLVTTGGPSPGVFVCPSDTNAVAFKGQANMTAGGGAAGNANGPFPLVTGDGIVTAAATKRSWSYGFQVSGAGAQTSNSTRFAIMADRPPCMTDHSANPGGTGKMVALGAAAVDGPSASTYIQLQTTNVRKTINSPNHGGNGQNVLYQDGHADWANTPCCGVNDDNVYTTGTVGAATTGMSGTTPNGLIGTPVTSATTCTPVDQDDSVIVDIVNAAEPTYTN